MSQINLRNVASVRTLDKKLSYQYDYLPERKLWFLTLRKEGVYSTFTSHYISSGETFNNMMRDYILIGDIVYDKPRVIIQLNNGDEEEKVFDTYEQARKFADDIIDESGCKFINI